VINFWGGIACGLPGQALLPKNSGCSACIFAQGIFLQDKISIRVDVEDSMFEGLFQPTHLLMIAGIALLVLGPKKLPELGKGLGESIRGFKSAMATKEELPEPAKKDL
jgi:sec-independent protein translocase protein TatA